jgi:hypothetical protein
MAASSTDGASFQFDQETLDEIENLRIKFGAKDHAEVIRKALGLAKLAAANTDASSVLTIVTPDNVRQRIKLAD